MKAYKLFFVILLLLLAFSPLEAKKKASKKTQKSIPTMTQAQEQQFKYYFYPAVDCFLRGEYDKATSYLLFCNELYAYDATVNMYLGIIYKSAKMVDSANVYLRRAYELQHDEYWYQYVRLLMEQKDLSTAISILEKEHLAQPKSLDVLTNLMRLYLTIGDYDKALMLQNDADKLLGAMSPQSVSSRLKVLEAAGKKEEATQLLDKYLAENPEDSQLMNKRGDYYLEQGDESNAIRCYMQSKAWATIANHYLEQKRYQEAEQMWLKQLYQTPNDEQVWLKLLNTMQSDSATTTEEIAQVIRNGYNEIESAEWNYYMTTVLVTDSLVDSAIVVAREGRFLPGNAKFKIALGIMLGDLYCQRNQFDSAFSAYEWVLQLDPENAYTLNNYAYTLATNNGDLKKAEKMSQISIAQEANNPIYLDTYAWIMYLQKQYDLALYYIERAIDRAKELNLGDENTKEIHEHHQAILKKIPNKPNEKR